MLMLSGVFGIFALMSSLHVKGGMATTYLTVSYVLAITANLAGTFCIRRFGIRNLLVTGSFCYSVFVILNSYTSSVTVLLACVLYAFGSGLAWISLPLFNTFFGESTEKQVRNRNSQKNSVDYKKRYSGIGVPSLHRCQSVRASGTVWFT